MKKSTNELKDRVFILTGEKAPLSYTLPSRNTKRFSLLYFDGTANRALRYSRNQKSVFEDEQDDRAILEPIVFEDGTLVVAATNPVLGKFLDMHPLNGEVYRELNTEKVASKEIEDLNVGLDAQIAARELSLDSLVSVGRLLYGASVDNMTTPELKRDVLMYSRDYPIQFLELINDPDLEGAAMASRALSEGLFSLRNNNREIWFNMAGNKRKLMNLQEGDDAVSVLNIFLESEGGSEIAALVQSKLS